MCSPVLLLAAAAVAVAMVGAGGCQRSLFADKGPRTQFETYDRMRQRNINPVVTDVFGNPQPALRARLSSTR